MMRRFLYLMIAGFVLVGTLGGAAFAGSDVPQPMMADDLLLVSTDNVEVELLVNERTGETAMIPAIRAVYEPKELTPSIVAMDESLLALAYGGNCQAIFTVPDPYVTEDFWGNDRATAYAELEVTAACSTGVFWRHQIQEKQFTVWVSRGGTYSDTVDPGETDYDVRSDGCTNSNNEDWKNDTNVVDNQRVLACNN